MTTTSYHVPLTPDFTTAIDADWIRAEFGADPCGDNEHFIDAIVLGDGGRVFFDSKSLEELRVSPNATWRLVDALPWSVDKAELLESLITSAIAEKRYQNGDTSNAPLEFFFDDLGFGFDFSPVTEEIEWFALDVNGRCSMTLRRLIGTTGDESFEAIVFAVLQAISAS